MPNAGFALPESIPFLTTSDAPRAVSPLLAELGVDGWLLYDFRDQNPLAHEMLGLGKTTRRAFALFRAHGDPILLRHAIEASSWRRWPWENRSYAGWKEMEEELGRLLDGMSRVAMEVSPRSAVPTVDRVPSGIVEVVRGCGVEVVSSGDLVSHFHAKWSDADLAAHRRAAVAVRDVAHDAFARVGDALRSGLTIREGELSGWIDAELARRGFPDQVGSIVAIGVNASDPHYHPGGDGAEIRPGVPLLIDLWGGEPGRVPADQTWMAWIGSDPDARTVQVWTAVRDARDRALDLLRDAHGAGRTLRGWEVDRAARDLLDERGFGRWFVHRLGHSIDRELHGSGPNLDDLETRDERRILPGVGFSVEPGVYIPGEIGVRSEVNVFWGEAGPEITPDGAQTELILVDVGVAEASGGAGDPDGGNEGAPDGAGR